MSYTHCPNCNKSLTGVFKGVLVTQEQTEFYNKHLKLDKPGYCSICTNNLDQQIVAELRKTRNEQEKRLREIIHHVPVLTSQAPIGWNYEVIDMVTSQTTSGTGFLTELSQSFHDFFGSTSNTTNQKIANATALCKADLRIQCIKKGGNIVIATDIDFNEVGTGSTNMLMVCMAGTAVKLMDTHYLSEATRSHIDEIAQLVKSIMEISNIKLPT